MGKVLGGVSHVYRIQFHLNLSFYRCWAELPSLGPPIVSHHPKKGFHEETFFVAEKVGAGPTGPLMAFGYAMHSAPDKGGTFKCDRQTNAVLCSFVRLKLVAMPSVPLFLSKIFGVGWVCFCDLVGVKSGAVSQNNSWVQAQQPFVKGEKKARQSNTVLCKF